MRSLVALVLALLAGACQSAEGEPAETNRPILFAIY